MACCADADGKTVWTTGVDPRVVEIRRDPESPAGWVSGHVNKKAQRDVLALAFVSAPGYPSNGIVFAGDDPRLHVTCTKRLNENNKTFSANIKNFANNARIGCTPVDSSTSVSLSSKTGILVHRLNQIVEIWRLGSTSTVPTTMDVNSFLPMNSEPAKLAVIPVKSGYCSSCAINEDASLLVISDESQTNVFQLALPLLPEDEQCSIVKLKSFQGKLSPSLVLAGFCPGDAGLFVGITRDGMLEALRVKGEENVAVSKLALPLRSEGLATCLTLAMVSVADSIKPLAVVGFTSGYVDVIDIHAASTFATLPSFEGIAVTAVGVCTESRRVVAVYANLEVILYDLDTRRTLYYPGSGKHKEHWRNSFATPLPIVGAIFLNSTKLLLFNENNCYRFCMNKMADEEVDEEEAKRLNTSDTFARVPGALYQFKKNVGEVLHYVGVLENGELVWADTTLEKLEGAMPEPLLKKIFGT